MLPLNPQKQDTVKYWLTYALDKVFLWSLQK